MPVVDEIRIDNRSPLSDRVIKGNIKTRPGEPLDLEKLSDDLGRLFGLDAFERVRFDLQREGERMVLLFQLDARERGRHYLRFGLNLESDLGHDANFNLGINHVWMPINSWDGELRTTGQIGDTMEFGTELYQPVEPRDWIFVEPFVNYQRRDVDVYQRKDRLATFKFEQTITGMYVGVNLTNVAQLRAGIGYLDGDARRDTGDPNVFHHTKFSGGLYAAQLEYDTLDDVRFPNDGSYLLADSQFFRKELGFAESFERYRVGFSTFRTWRRNTIGLGLKYEASKNAGPRIEAVHSLGGFLNHSAFARNSLTGQYVGLARLMVYRRIASPAVFAWEFPVYLGAQVEVGNAWDHQGDWKNDELVGGGPFVGVDTPLGPLYLAYAHGETGEDRAYLYLGRSF
jgi:NTE family protein